MSDRPRDLAWEALVSVTNANVSEERGALNRALSQIREQTAELDLDPGELAMVINRRAEIYREVWPSVALTATALAKHWERVPIEHERMLERRTEEAAAEQEKRRTRGVNLQPRNGCVTCGSDRWVVVKYRPAAKPTSPQELGHEEVAPCPVCNTESKVMAHFWDGRSWAYGTRPGEVVIA